MKNLHTSLITVLLLIGIFLDCNKHESVPVLIPSRIISFAPSITETVFALRLGNKLVGVTTYCNYPDDAKKIDKIGGYSEINLEKVVSLKPDLVILQSEHRKQIDFLEKMKIPVLIVKYSNFSSICNSITAIGKACGAGAVADSVLTTFSSRLNSSNGLDFKPKILLCVGRDNPGNGTIKGVFAAGQATFYSDIINAAGGVNAYSDSLPQYPKFSVEGIITLAPDIVIDIVSSMGSNACSTLINDWKSIKMIPAVKNNKVFCISSDYATVPGPRIILLLDEVKRIVESYFSDTENVVSKNKIY